jgi:hypothetical protein
MSPLNFLILIRLTHVYEIQQQGSGERQFGYGKSNQGQNNYSQSEVGDQDAVENLNSEKYVCERGEATRTRKSSVVQHTNGCELNTHILERAEPDGYRHQSNDGPCQSPRCSRQYHVRSNGGKARALKWCSPGANYLDGPEVFGYGDFDILDRQRPSIQRQVKTGNRLESLDCAQPEFENRLQKAWENDRAKKRIQKKTREDLRQLGLLDKHGKARPKTRFGQVLPLGIFEVEVKIFLQSSRER